MNVLWPERKWVAERIVNSDLRVQNSGEAVLGLTTSENVNDVSYFIHLRYGEFDALFTGKPSTDYK